MKERIRELTSEKGVMLVKRVSSSMHGRRSLTFGLKITGIVLNTLLLPVQSLCP